MTLRRNRVLVVGVVAAVVGLPACGADSIAALIDGGEDEGQAEGEENFAPNLAPSSRISNPDPSSGNGSDKG